MPSKVWNINNIKVCFNSVTHDEEFIFEKSQKTIYAFGCNGYGFKYIPYNGKRIFHLVEGNFSEASKYKKKENINDVIIAKL